MKHNEVRDDSASKVEMAFDQMKMTAGAGCMYIGEKQKWENEEDLEKTVVSTSFLDLSCYEGSISATQVNKWDIFPVANLGEPWSL